VRSLNYRGTGKTQHLKFRYTRRGAKHVLLAGRKVRAVAQLVLLAFGEPRPSEKYFSHHKDENRQNDCIENLEWRHISIQNGINYSTGFKFPKGHSYGLKGIKFQKGNTIGMQTRFKSNGKRQAKPSLSNEKGDIVNTVDLNG
jgi:hypothetical protein